MANTKVRRSLLVSAVRNASVSCVVQGDAVQQYCRLYLNVTAAGGGVGITVVIRGYDMISGLPVAITPAGAAITATAGLYVYELVPSANVAAGAVMWSLGRILPVSWDVQVIHGDGANWTYSLSCEVFPG
jgi:hypothetical protein